MTKKLFVYAIAALAALQSAAAQPRLIVQIVVGSMRGEDLDRYAENFGEGGFRRLTEGGTVYADSRYDYLQTTTPVSLATLTTGAMPSTHGVISTRWRDYIVNKTVGLIDDPSVRDPEYYHGNGAYSPRNLIAPTVGEALLRQSPDSRSVTVALDPISAVVMGGREGMTFWMDSVSCNWTTSTYYLPVLPAWVKRFNADKLYLSYIGEPWHSLLNDDKYRNKRCSDIVLMSSMAKKKRSADTSADAVKRISSKAPSESRYDNILYSPAGNCLTLQFAKTALTQLDLGKRDRTDLLNICLDAPRAIREAYGPESIEAEDMYYRLDQDLEEFLTYVYTLFKPHEVLVILTSDHGSSPSYDFGREACDRFNTRQFEVIVNGFLSARYGPGNWVLEYEDKCLYLNHNLVYEKDLSLADIQNEVATFAMQFRGVSHALSATAMRTSYFGSGYARKMQNSFYPRRSGDVIINLMPGWIEEHDHKRSSSGSMYGYDTEVPLVFYGKGAGKLPTASAVVADVIDALKEGVKVHDSLFWKPAEKPEGLLEDRNTYPWYLRVTGVAAALLPSVAGAGHVVFEDNGEAAYLVDAATSADIAAVTEKIEVLGGKVALAMKKLED